jgi:hypothetical protein
VRAAVGHREERVVDTDHAYLPAVDVDDTTAVAADLVDLTYRMLHAVTCRGVGVSRSQTICYA